MGRTLSLILLVILSIVLVRTHCLSILDGQVDLESLIYGGALVASIGFIAFQCRIWSGDCGAMLKKRSASFNAGPSSLDGMCSSGRAFLKLLGIPATIIITVLEFQGRHDIVMQFLFYVGGKLSKLIAFLITP